jgi:hypothetical protein
MGDDPLILEALERLRGDSPPSVLQECLESGRRFEEEMNTPEGQAMLAKFLEKATGDFPPSPVRENPPD